MSKLLRVQPPAVCSKLQVAKEDLLEISREDHIRIVFLLHLIREFESTVLDLWEENMVHGPAHISIGQEAVAGRCICTMQNPAT